MHARYRRTAPLHPGEPRGFGDAARPRRAAQRRSLHLLFGTGDGVLGAVYGSIVVMGTIAAGSEGNVSPDELATVVPLTVVVLWVAHVYAFSLSEGIRQGHGIDRGEIAGIAGRQLTILLAGLAPVIALVLGATGVLPERGAIWLALGAGLATLAIQGARYGWSARGGWPGTLAVVAANLVLGLVIVVMEAVILH